MATAIEAVQADSTGSEAPRFRKRAELSQNELPARDQLVDMCSTLSRAILQNSYYSDDHPQVRQLGEEPFRHWKTLGESHQELSFVVASWSDEEIMALDGVFSEAVGLDLLIGGTAGEHYARKLF
ncbi:MAG: hypothetical protein VX223_16670, partial [Myxococcota bacterium]|nr:hypothetical protein [Myxococcota bacterium]